MRAAPVLAGLGMLALQPGDPVRWAAVVDAGLLLPVLALMAGMALLLLGGFGLLALVASWKPGGVRK
jgi:hypothetical protein